VKDTGKASEQGPSRTTRSAPAPNRPIDLEPNQATGAQDPTDSGL